MSDSFDPTEDSPPDSSVQEILQARMLEWVPVPSPGDLPDPRVKPASLTTPALAGGFFTTSTIWEAQLEDRMGDVKCFW